MINKPSVEELEKKIPVHFVIVNAIAKRSREISEGAKVRIETSEKNSLSIAAEELNQGVVRVAEAPIQEIEEDEVNVQDEVISEESNELTQDQTVQETMESESE